MKSVNRSKLSEQSFKLSKPDDFEWTPVDEDGQFEAGDIAFVRIDRAGHNNETKWPFWISENSMRKLTYVDSFHYVLEFGADERVASVCGVHMQPQIILLANWSDFFQVVERTARRGAQRGGHEERYQAKLDVLLHDVV